MGACSDGCEFASCSLHSEMIADDELVVVRYSFTTMIPPDVSWVIRSATQASFGTELERARDHHGQVHDRQAVWPTPRVSCFARRCNSCHNDRSKQASALRCTCLYPSDSLYTVRGECTLCSAQHSLCSAICKRIHPKRSRPRLTSLDTAAGPAPAVPVLYRSGDRSGGTVPARGYIYGHKT